MGYEEFEALRRRGLLRSTPLFLNDIPPNNSREKETKTASEERKEPEIKPFHERYKEERIDTPLSKQRNDTPLYAHS